MISSATPPVARLYKPRSEPKQNESNSGRHSLVDHSVIPTAIRERRPVWSHCISTARYTNCNQRGENISGAAVYQQKSVKQTPQAPAISKAEAYLAELYTTKTTRKTKAKALLDDTTVSTRAVFKPRSAKRNSIWHICISIARYISAAIGQAQAYLAQLCINSDHKPKRKPSWTRRPRRP